MPFYRRPSPARGPLRPGRPRSEAAPSPPGAVGYAVIDLETTGLSPASDSILEIGLVLADPAGRPQRRWSSLIHPGPAARDRRAPAAATAGQAEAAGTSVEVGPTFIHGLVPADLQGAPRLDEVADLLVGDLAGRVVVAHNARFDVGFLSRALGRTGHLAPGARVPRMCTMQWARHFMTTPSRRLTSCCRAAGIRIGRHHTALDDAEAAAALLRHYLAVAREREQTPVPWAHSLQDAAGFTGWNWDESAALAQSSRLVPRSGPGVLRQEPDGHS